MKQVGTRQLPGSLHLFPADGAIIRVLLQLFARSHRIVLLQVVPHPQVVPVLLVLALDLMEEIPQLHAYHQTGHGEEDVAPQEHVQVMHQVDYQGGQFKAQLDVVGDGAPFLPNLVLLARVDGGVGLVTHVVQV